MMSRQTGFLSSLSLLILGALLAFGAVAEAEASGDEERGQAILERLDREMQVDGRIMDQVMLLENQRGQQRSRTIRTWNRNMGEQMLIRFLAPADVQGTAFLLVGDDMWLYMPATGRVRRIAGHARRGQFMGSDFSYNDMETFGSTGFGPVYRARYLRDETVDGRQMHVLELIPRSGAEADYSHLVLWADAERHLPRRVEHYDDETLLKVLETREMERISARWTATEVTMQTLARGTTTSLLVEEVTYDEAIPDELFSVRHLEGGR